MCGNLTDVSEGACFDLFSSSSDVSCTQNVHEHTLRHTHKDSGTCACGMTTVNRKQQAERLLAHLSALLTFFIDYAAKHKVQCVCVYQCVSLCCIWGQNRGFREEQVNVNMWLSQILNTFMAVLMLIKLATFFSCLLKFVFLKFGRKQCN